ncbi:MAG TPA: autotransporter-associated beta strand repeat-containing protein [Caulobacteraceae bacterium]|jgi:autotransporter-associated beta strand protein|nr:autotransporter-associated beta strand repeat-containing protein [Caulobacteraceae bacterium]
MTAISWANGVTGDWNDASKWNFGFVPTAADDVEINNAGIFTVSVTTADVANSLTFDAVNAILSESTAGSLDIGGAFDLEAGTVLLRHANSFGSVNVTGGRLATYVGSALGSANLTLDGGEFTGMASENVSNRLAMGGAGTLIIDAATGTTLDLGAASPWGLDATSKPVIQFGSSVRRGVVEWSTPAFSEITGVGNYTVDVAGGVLKAGDSSFGFLLGDDSSTTIAAGAEIDLNGFSARITNLVGAGSVANAGASAVLTVAGGDFSGVIGGNLSVEISAGVDFGGVETYSGATIIDSGQYLRMIGAGSVTGAIIDNGSLYDQDASGTFTPGVISGSGFVVFLSQGTMVFDHANSYSGTTSLGGGTVVIGNGQGFGTGQVTMDYTKLIGTVTETVTNALTLRGTTTTIAAASGTKLTLTGGSLMDFDSVATALDLTFGDAAHEGKVVIGGSQAIAISGANPISVTVAYGTLEAAGYDVAELMHAAQDVTVAAGATLDLGGVGTFTPNLISAGSIVNSSTTLATLYTEKVSSVSGVISGRLAVDVVNGLLVLTGIDTFTGGATINSGAGLVLGGGGSIKGAVDDEGSFTVQDTGPLTLSGAISGAGSLTLAGPGTLTLGGASTYTGGTTVEHGQLIVTNGKALGAQGLTLDNHTTLISTATMTLLATGAGAFTFNGASTIAAAHGTTLTIGGSESVKVNAATLNFGQAGDDGVIVFKANTASGALPLQLNVRAGVLRAGDAAFGDDLTIDAASITVAAGAALDLGGFDVEAPKLLGAGAVINSGAAATLADDSGTFAGVISGNIKLAPGNVVLTGTNTYTSGTTINSGDTLQLGAGGTTGSIVGTIDDEGTLTIDRSNALTLTAISGAGAVVQKGAGTTTLSGLNSYGGGTTISRGELISGRAAALGTGGTITMTGGELLASVSQTLSHDLTTSGSVTIAAATGTVLTLATATVDMSAGALYFGDAGDAGTVVLKISSALNILDPTLTKVEVRAGVLEAGDDELSVVLNNVEATRIDSGATIDAAGHSLEINSLSGVGAVTNSGPAATLTLFNSTSYGGVISGRFSLVEFDGDATLTGDETFTGTAVIEGGSLTLSGLFAENVQFNSGGTLVLAKPSRFTGRIEDFQSGATVDLKNITSGAGASLAYDAGTGVLTVRDGTHTDTLKFASGLVLGNFAATSDGAGGTDIGWQAAPAAARSPAPVDGAAMTAAPSPSRLVDAMASLSAPYTAATLLMAPPGLPQPALAITR